MKNVAIVIFDEVEVLDFAGPFEIFSVTGRRDPGGPPFNVYTVAEKASPIAARNNLIVTPHYSFENCPQPDILVVPGGYGTRREMHNPAMLNWVKMQAARIELLTSVCTGSLVLGQAGLLEGLRATTHHGSYDELIAISPNITVERGVRYVDNGFVVTSAGVQAGMDMALHVVARVCGEAVARETADYIEYVWEPSRQA